MFYAAVNAKQTPAFLRNADCVPCVTPPPRRQRDQVAPFVTFDSAALLKNDTGMRERKTQSTQKRSPHLQPTGWSQRTQKTPQARHSPYGRKATHPTPRPTQALAGAQTTSASVQMDSWALRRNKEAGQVRKKQRKLSQGNRKKRQYRPARGKRATKPTALTRKHAASPDQRTFTEEQTFGKGRFAGRAGRRATSLNMSDLFDPKGKWRE